MLNTETGVKQFIENIRITSQQSNISDLLNSPQSAQAIARNKFDKLSNQAQNKITSNYSKILPRYQSMVASGQKNSLSQDEKATSNEQQGQQPTYNNYRSPKDHYSIGYPKEAAAHSLLAEYSQYLDRRQRPFVQERNLQQIKSLQAEELGTVELRQKARFEQIKREIQRKTQEEREQAALKHRQKLLEEARKTIQDQQAQEAAAEREKKLQKQIHEQRLQQLSQKAELHVEKRQFRQLLRIFNALCQKLAKIQSPAEKIAGLKNFCLKTITFQSLKEAKKSREEIFKQKQMALREEIAQNDRRADDFREFRLGRKFFKVMRKVSREAQQRKDILEYQKAQLSKIEAFLKRRCGEMENAQESQQNCLLTQESQESEQDPSPAKKNDTSLPQRKNLKQMSKQIVIKSASNQEASNQSQNQQNQQVSRENLDPECQKQFKAKPYKRPEEPKFLRQMKERELLRQKAKEDKERQRKEREEQLKLEEERKKLLLQEKLQALKLKAQTVQKEFYEKIAFKKLRTKFKVNLEGQCHVAIQIVSSKVFRAIRQRYTFQMRLTDERNVKIIKLLSHVYQQFLRRKIINVVRLNKELTDNAVNAFIRKQQETQKMHFFQLWNQHYNEILRAEKQRAKEIQKKIYTKTGIHMFKFNIVQNKEEREWQQNKEQLIKDYYAFLEQLNYHQAIDQEMETIFNNMFDNNKPEVLSYFEYESQWILDKGILNQLRSKTVNKEESSPNI